MALEKNDASFVVVGIISCLFTVLFTVATLRLRKKYPIKNKVVKIILIIICSFYELFSIFLFFYSILTRHYDFAIVFIMCSVYLIMAIISLSIDKKEHKQVILNNFQSAVNKDFSEKDLEKIPKINEADSKESIEQVRLREAQEYKRQFNQFQESRAISEKQEQTKKELTQKESLKQREIEKEIKKHVKAIEHEKKVEIDRIKREQKQYYDIQVNKLAQSLAEKKAKELVRQEEERKKRVERSRVYELYQTANHKLAECDSMNGFQFERFCGDLLRKNGFKNVEVTQGSGDYGIDILAEKDEVTYAIQCKCYSSKIGNKVIQEVYSGKAFYNRMVGVIMTNNYFTQSAIDTAKKTKILLWNRDKLKEFIRESLT